MAMPITVPRYTVADLDDFPEDGNRYELLDGVLLVTPAPGTMHQGVLSRLQAQVYTAVGASGLAHVVSPGVIRVPPGTQLEPDLLVYPARFPLGILWEEITERWLAVETLSRSSRMYDREFKRPAYLAVGVAEVWLVDIANKCVEVSNAGAEGHIERAFIRWQPPTFDRGFEIDLARVFDGVA
jgi:Uma2 family endonuclease